MNSHKSKTVLAVGAHPDDVELLCAGTLALLHEQGWNVECATMTSGDCGSATLSRAEISAVRRNEAAASAALLGGAYHCMECDDVFVSYDRATLLKVIALIRQVGPEIVFTMSPQDYMVDHEVTSVVVQTACFAAGMKNIETNDAHLLPGIPHLYYCDPLEGKDKFGNEIRATTVVDISRTFALKQQMLLCHKSQLSWLKTHHGVDEYVHSMQTFARKRGAIIEVQYAEGFRQHLGHAFPQENMLKQALDDVVRVLPT